jgi:protein subunit release factor A
MSLDPNFSRRIYDEAKKLFPEGAVEALVSRPVGPTGQPGNFDPAVRLVHAATGVEITCSDFPTQIENYIAAAIRLRIACDERGH